MIHSFFYTMIPEKMSPNMFCFSVTYIEAEKSKIYF